MQHVVSRPQGTQLLDRKETRWAFTMQRTGHPPTVTNTQKRSVLLSAPDTAKELKSAATASPKIPLA